MAHDEQVDVDVDDCDGYVVLVVDRRLGQVDSHGPYDHAAAEAERRRRQRVVDTDALDGVHVRLARFHWPVVTFDVRSALLHDCGGSSEPVTVSPIERSRREAARATSGESSRPDPRGVRDLHRPRP